MGIGIGKVKSPKNLLELVMVKIGNGWIGLKVFSSFSKLTNCHQYSTNLDLSTLFSSYKVGWIKPTYNLTEMAVEFAIIIGLHHCHNPHKDQT